MSEPGKRGPFVLRVSFDQPELIGARWWQEALLVEADPTSRRDALKKLLGVGGIVVAGGLGLAAGMSKCGHGNEVTDGFDSSPSSGGGGSGPGFDNAIQSLDIQRKEGWDRGAKNQKLGWRDGAKVDADGVDFVPGKLPDLVTELRPKQERLQPYYVPTLLQTVEAPANSGFKAEIQPVFSMAQARTYARGQSVLTLFEGVGKAQDTAIIVDLPGSDSVAFATAVSARFEPVFVFDNWPHPKGVVPSHQTLGALVYYLPVLRRTSSGVERPPVFVLDRDRLSPYVDDGAKFDNRYVAKLPSAAQFATLGVKHVLYIVPEGAPLRELDDLNDDFVNLKAQKIDVRVLSLADFQRSKDDPTPEPVAKPGSPTNQSTYYYGSHPHSHFWFWRHYPWYSYYPSGPFFAPSRFSGGHQYEPAPRRSLFSSGFVGGHRTSPPGFGRTTVPAPRNLTGGGTPQKSTGSSGRSGSFGRSSSFGSSGG